MLGHDNLMNFYKTNFALMQHHKYSLSDLEGMIPWERYLYVDLLKAFIKEQEEKMRDQAAMRKAQAQSQVKQALAPQRKR
jgi:hypothetical protein